MFRCQFAPGDIVMLTAAVRDLHRCYPGQFVTDVRSLCPGIWENNPYTTPLPEEDPTVEQIECLYPLINGCDRVPYHCLHGFIKFLNEKLGLHIQPTEFRGDIHLSPQERAWYSQVRELTGEDTPFWIIGAGGKYDISIKWWRTERYQAVVDHFCGKIQFVQIGELGHYHPKLDGVIDLRGRTSLRELIRLVHHAQGVVCGVTSLMHLAAAVPTRRGQPATRPCVVIAGGREPAHWEAYPGHQFLHTNGALACCAKGGCWRDRTFPLRDGGEEDRPDRRCVDVVNGLPHCMDMITPAEVIRRVELYFNGGRLKFLSERQHKTAERGVKATARNRFDQQPLSIFSAGTAGEAFIRGIPPCPTTFKGRGIVICGGGGTYFPCAWVCVNMLRRLGCRLPIQLWYLGKAEINPEMVALLTPLDVECVDASMVRKRFPARRLTGWELKPYSMLHARFKEILLLDADNVPTVDPTFLFDSPEFRASGAMFWPDFDLATGVRARPIWRSCGLSQPKEREFESGQILVDKERCWRALCLAMWFNENSDFYYRHLHGDKETFHLAFRKLKQSYTLIPKPVKALKGAMCQHDFAGRRIFQHRNNRKWNFFHNQRVEGFEFEEECLQDLAKLRTLWDGAIEADGSREMRALAQARPLSKEARILPVIISCENRATFSRQTKENFEKTDWENLPIRVQMDNNDGADHPRRHTQCAYLALQNSLQSDADYVLLLEDDLEFNRYLSHNLQRWHPIQTRRVTLASLYNPSVRESACAVGQNTRIVAASRATGNQAFLIARLTVKHLVLNWNKVDAPLDAKIPRLAGRLARSFLYHAPSLVQCTGKAAPWHEAALRAVDFDPTWRG